MNHPRTSAAALAALLLAVIPGAVSIGGGGQECYVCLPGEEGEPGGEELQRQFPGEELPSCAPTPHRPPVKSCPPQYRGCLTQYNGEKVTRSCGELNITTCQMANGVYYCYCKEPMCNGPENDRSPPHPGQEPASGEHKGGGGGALPDDEDMVPSEGSGGGGSHNTRQEDTRPPSHKPPRQESPTVEPRAASRAPHHSISPFIPLTLIATLLAQ